MSGPSAPKMKTPAPPPPMPTMDAPRRELGDEKRVTEIERKKRGRSALRIDPQTGGVSSRGGAGINIPMK